MHSHYTNINLASPEEHRALLQRNFSDLEDMFQLHSLSSVHDWVWEMVQFELEPLAAAATLFVQAQRDAFKANVSVDAAFGEPRLRTYDDDAALVADTFPDLEGLLIQKLSIKVTHSQTWPETLLQGYAPGP
ncbi:hypothetical protein B0H14DRAFT_3467118 [Mycena olivaceomarginata]|nr:hypothetical protein B0H14DRAFT_3467118 [Mycena olivaceomarginata]